MRKRPYLQETLSISSGDDCVHGLPPPPGYSCLGLLQLQGRETEVRSRPRAIAFAPLLEFGRCALVERSKNSPQCALDKPGIATSSLELRVKKSQSRIAKDPIFWICFFRPCCLWISPAPKVAPWIVLAHIIWPHLEGWKALLEGSC